MLERAWATVEVTNWYQSLPRSSHSSAGMVGHPMSTWKPATAAPNAKSSPKPPFLQPGARAAAARPAARRPWRVFVRAMPVLDPPHMAYLAAAGEALRWPVGPAREGSP